MFFFPLRGWLAGSGPLMENSINFFLSFFLKSSLTLLLKILSLHQLKTNHLLRCINQLLDTVWSPVSQCYQVIKIRIIRSSNITKYNKKLCRLIRRYHSKQLWVVKRKLFVSTKYAQHGCIRKSMSCETLSLGLGTDTF